MIQSPFIVMRPYPEIFMHLFAYTLTERKSRMPRIQGIKGEAVFVILRTIDNVGGGALSAFPEGKQKGIKNRHLHLSMGRVNK